VVHSDLFPSSPTLIIVTTKCAILTTS